MSKYFFFSNKTGRKKFSSYRNWNFGKSVCHSVEVGTSVNVARPVCALQQEISVKYAYILSNNVTSNPQKFRKQEQ